MTGDVRIDTNFFIYAYDPRLRPNQKSLLSKLN